MADIRTFPEMPSIIVSSDDQQRLTLLALDALQRAPDVAAELLAEMERAEVVEAVPRSIVQMGSRVTFVADGQERSVVLVYPGLADIGAGRVSILTPIGTALIGLSEGQSIAWRTRDGRQRQLTVRRVEADAGTESALT
jgi:regulator of nucleoside diphosphate kinase